jgi:general secretion pathway protein H
VIATRCWSGHRQAGFSLLELLVTLMVVVLITALVTLNIGTGGQDIRLEGQLRDLAGVAAFALDEAQMGGVDYGLLLYRDAAEDQLLYAYSWRERRPEGWRAATSSRDVLASGKLPGNVELTLELEGAKLGELELFAAEDATPQVIFYSSGEVAEGAMIIRQRDSGELLWRLQWDLLGRFELQRGDEI